jgi:cysteine desulfurase / selenocysteine lyase
MEFTRSMGGNPGRSGHRLSIAASRAVETTRESLARLFHVEDASRIIFTKNATEGINLSLYGLLSKGDCAVLSAMEHNAVARPMRHLEAQGVEVRVCPCDGLGFLDLDALQGLLSSGNTRLVAVCHASNVTGTVQDVGRVADICHRHGALLLVDAAQSAGVLDIDVQATAIDILAFTGHKGLMGPQGVGGLYLADGIEPQPLVRGGTGSKSDSDVQPDFLPDKYEGGTLNALGIHALGASLGFLLGRRREIEEKERELTRVFLEKAGHVRGVRLFGPEETGRRTAVVSLNLDGMECSEVSRLLDEEYGILTRPGLHCAPLAHRNLATFPRGTVRFSFGFFNTFQEVDRAALALQRIAKGHASRR